MTKLVRRKAKPIIWAPFPFAKTNQSFVHLLLCCELVSFGPLLKNERNGSEHRATTKTATTTTTTTTTTISTTDSRYKSPLFISHADRFLCAYFITHHSPLEAQQISSSFLSKALLIHLANLPGQLALSLALFHSLRHPLAKIHCCKSHH